MLEIDLQIVFISVLAGSSNRLAGAFSLGKAVKCGILYRLALVIESRLPLL